MEGCQSYRDVSWQLTMHNLQRNISLPLHFFYVMLSRFLLHSWLPPPYIECPLISILHKPSFTCFFNLGPLSSLSPKKNKGKRKKWKSYVAVPLVWQQDTFDTELDLWTLDKSNTKSLKGLPFPSSRIHHRLFESRNNARVFCIPYPPHYNSLWLTIGSSSQVLLFKAFQGYFQKKHEGAKEKIMVVHGTPKGKISMSKWFHRPLFNDFLPLPLGWQNYNEHGMKWSFYPTCTFFPS